MKEEKSFSLLTEEFKTALDELDNAKNSLYGGWIENIVDDTKASLKDAQCDNSWEEFFIE